MRDKIRGRMKRERKAEGGCVGWRETRGKGEGEGGRVGVRIQRLSAGKEREEIEGHG